MPPGGVVPSFAPYTARQRLILLLDALTTALVHRQALAGHVTQFFREDDALGGARSQPVLLAPDEAAQGQAGEPVMEEAGTVEWTRLLQLINHVRAEVAPQGGPR